MGKITSSTSSKTKFSGFDILTTFLLGIIAAIPIGFALYLWFSEEIEASLQTALFAALGACIAVLICIVFVRVIFKKLIGHEEPSLRSALDQAEIALEEASIGNWETARKGASQAFKDVVAVYSWMSARRWLGGIFLGAIALFAGVGSTYFLVQQNAILQVQQTIMDDQNRVIAQQSEIFSLQAELSRNAMLMQEAQRYLPLNSELNEVLGLIREQGSVDRTAMRPYNLVVLSRPLTARIEALTLAYRPYWYVDAFSNETMSLNDLSSVPEMVFLSPERGLLLKAILQNRVALRFVEEEDPTTADFSFADMRGVEIVGSSSGPITSDFYEFGSCFYMSGIYTMLPYQPESGDLVEDEAKLQFPDSTGFGLGLSMPIYVPGSKSDSIDFSYSRLNDVFLVDEFGTMTFEGAELTNVKFMSRERLDLSGSFINSVTVERMSGLDKVRIIAHDAIIRGPLCADGFFLPSQSGNDVDAQNYRDQLPEFLEATQNALDASSSDFSGARISEWLISEGHFDFAGLPQGSYEEVTDDKTDYQLLVMPLNCPELTAATQHPSCPVEIQ